MILRHQTSGPSRIVTVITECITPAAEEDSKNLKKTCQEGQLMDTLQSFDQPRVSECFIDYVHTLQGCMNKKDLVGGRHMHANIITNGMQNMLLENILINMYAKCGSIGEAYQLFDKMHEKDMFTWSNMISGYVNNGFAGEALTLFLKMGLQGVEPDILTYSSVLKACAILGSLQAGKLLHKNVMEMGLEINVFLGSALIDMYLKCGSLEDACKVFNKMPSRNVVSWSTMISGLVQYKQSDVALKLFSEMQLEGVKPNEVTYMSVLKGCASLAALDQGRQVHFLIKQSGHDVDIFVASTIIDMYAKCGSLVDAREVFNRMPVRNVVSYSTMIAGCVQSGQAEEALKLFEQMREENLKPDEVTFVSILNGLARMVALEEGKKIHTLIRKRGYESNKFVGSALVDMYAKCGSVKDAQEVFDQLAERDVVSWSSMIEAYSQCGLASEAFACFHKMEYEGIKPVSYTFVSILKACGSLAYLAKGKQIHSVIFKTQDELDVFVGSSLLDMYVKCSSVAEAEQVFHRLPKQNLVLWNAMITGFVQHSFTAKALMLFQQMQVECIQPNTTTLVSILKACSSVIDVEQGKQVHVFIISNQLDSEVWMLNALIDMYAKCGKLESAQCLFHSLPYRNVVSWNAIIAAHVQFEYAEDALKLFWRMVEECTPPDEVTFASILKACANLAALQQGYKFYVLMIQSGCFHDVPLYNTLIDMYAKCGSIQIARQVFDNMPYRSLISWNAMIVSYAQHGKAEEAFKLFWEMQQEGIKPNHVSFVGMLSACSHAGLLYEGKFYFIYMSQYHGITPMAEHFVCMVGLLGRAGQLGKAEGLIQGIPFEPPMMVWKTLLCACTSHRDLDLTNSVVGGLESDNITSWSVLSGQFDLEMKVKI